MDQLSMIDINEKKYILLTKLCHLKKKVLSDSIRCKQKYKDQTDDFYNGCSTVYSSHLSELDIISKEIEKIFSFDE